MQHRRILLSMLGMLATGAVATAPVAGVQVGQPLPPRIGAIRVAAGRAW